MFATLARYEERLSRAELTQIECLRILEKLEVEADRVKLMVREIVGHLDELCAKVLETSEPTIVANPSVSDVDFANDEKQELTL